MCKVICITNRHLCRGDFLERVELIARAHPSAIILREKDLPPEEYALLAGKVKDICTAYNTPLILHYFAHIAGAMGVNAVHLPLDILQKNGGIIRTFSDVGTSCHSVQDALTAQSLGCSYIIAGHIFPTDCKKGVPARGTEFLKQVCNAVDIPVYAIGGIDGQTAPSAIQAGADGVCSMSGFMTCSDAAQYIKELKNG